MAFRKKIVVITDDCSLNVNNEIIEILHPKAQIYNDRSPTYNWRMIKLPFCKERLITCVWRWTLCKICKKDT